MFQIPLLPRFGRMKRTIAMMFASCCLAASANAQPLIGHWTLDETSGTTAFDSVAGGTDGAIGANVNIGLTGKVGNAFEFTFSGGGTQDDVVDMGDAAFIDTIVQRDAMSVSAWLNWTSNPVARSVALSIASDTTVTNFINLGVTGSAPTAPQPPVFPDGRRFNTQGGVFGGINIAPGGAAGTDEIVNTTGFNDNTGAFPMGGEFVDDLPNPILPGEGTALNDGAWHHVVMTIDARNTEVVELFVDGTNVGTSLSPPIDEFSDLMDNFELGVLGRNMTHIAGYMGLLDEVQIYGRALTGNEVSFLFENPGEVVVPEPASLALLGLGASGLLLLGRQRRTLK